jgi:hypothetical protein
VQPAIGPVPSSTRLVRVYGAPNSLYILAISLGPIVQPCIPIPGFENGLIILPPHYVLSFGLTGPPLPSTSTIACVQGVANFTLNLPPVPAPTTFWLQALVDSTAAQGPAFTVAVEGTAF